MRLAPRIGYAISPSSIMYASDIPKTKLPVAGFTSPPANVAT
jgi:hypothetical protein